MFSELATTSLSHVELKRPDDETCEAALATEAAARAIVEAVIITTDLPQHRA